MQINEQYWGQPLSEYWGYNVRGGAESLTDPDFTTYPPFIRNNMNPDFVDSAGTTYTYSLRAAVNKVGSGWEVDKDYPDYSVAYVGIQNPALPQVDCVAVGQGSQAAAGAIVFDECFKSDPDDVMPIAFASNRPMRSYRSVSTYPIPHQQFDNPLYKTSQGRYTNGIRWYAPHSRDEGTWPTRNLSLDCAYWRSLGLRTFFGVIYVRYCDAALNSNGITTKYDYNPVTLHWYESQTAEWREEHPIHQAFLRMCIRYNTSGLYSFSYNPGDGIMPDIFYNMKINPEVIPNSEDSNAVFRGPAELFADANDQSDWLLFGSLNGSMQAIGSNTGGGMGSGNYPFFMGYHMGTFHSGATTAATSYQRTCWITYDGDDYEWLRRAAAAYGFFFTDGDTNDTGYADLFAEGNDTYRWVNDKMCLGIVRDGYTNGDYTRGMANPTAPNWGWADTTQSPYNPSLPPNPQPETGDNLPHSMKFSLVNTGTGVWALTKEEIGQVWDDIFGKDIKLEQFGDNPMNAILSLKWTPFVWSSSAAGPIVLGSQAVNQFHSSYPILNNQANSEQHGFGTIKFNFNKNFYNSRNIQARLFLPFYGYYELPAAQLLSSTLRVDFYYNAPDELGLWVISYDNVIYDYCECSCDIEVPITGSNAAAISANKRNEALSIATQVASLAATTLIGGGTAAGITGAARHLAQGIDALADVGFGWGSSGIESEAYLGTKGAGRGFKLGTAAGLISSGIGSAVGIYNTIQNARIERAALRTNLPYHGTALQSTFLHMSMRPYVQIFKNNIMEGIETENGGKVEVEVGGNSKTDYMLKVGHACDVWKNLTEMPAASLLQTTGMANMDTNGMTLAEVQELNSILQSGFFKSV